MTTGKKDGSVLTRDEVLAIITRGVPRRLVSGKKVLVLTPDATRTAPLPMMVEALAETVGKLASRMDFMVALGTHPVMEENKILELYGVSPAAREKRFKDTRFLNHRWDLSGTLRKIGVIPESEIDRLTGGLFKENVDIVINKAVFEYDLILILGPVFPHEVVGFSGGNKYLFPGISGGDFLHFFHWLAAVITCRKTIGIKHTPMRALLDRAAAMLAVPRWCLAMVVDPSGGLRGLFTGAPEEAWSQAADLSATTHIVYAPKPSHIVLGHAADMYGELWVGGKVMYKLEPVVADGGRLIIWGPQITEISRTWGTQLEKIGYHVRDYFLTRMSEFKGIPRGVLAHSTHVRGDGVFANGVERPRIDVILATGIPEKTCRKINLGYMDPASIRREEYENREREGILFVDHAGEILHRLEQERQAGVT
jgi:nickel-dependent lactate racemase